MPKVPDDHLERRRHQIVDAAATLVAERGFHGTSMRDVIAASGMSAGAVYHYFPTKLGLMQAIGGLVAERYGQALGDLPDAPDPATLVARAARAVLAGDAGRIGLLVWAEAVHDPVMADAAGAVVRYLRSLLSDVARGWQDAGRLPADADPEAVAAALYAVLPGFVVQQVTTGDVSPERMADGLAALLRFDR